MQTILITGGTGFIGSHTAVALLAAGRDVVLYDNLVNSRREVVDRIARIAGRAPHFVEGDVRDRERLTQVLRETRSDGVIHFAALKAVGESVREALAYYDQRRRHLGAASRRRRWCSSPVRHSPRRTCSAAKSLPPTHRPLRRSAELRRAGAGLSAAPIQAGCPAGELIPSARKESGLIGEAPNGIPNNLPYIAQVAWGQRERLSVFGGDYPTPDGTGVRDYIHVVDLAEGHLAALDYLAAHPGLLTVNLGTGRGYSVLEMVRAFERASGRAVPTKSSRDVPAISPRATPIPRWRTSCSAGVRNATSTRCAATPGAGSATGCALS